MQSLTIRRPDDWHVHVRDGAMLRTVARFTARQFARAIVMPNLSPPVTSVDAAAAYRERVRAAAGPGFTPLMTCYLTDDADGQEIVRGHADGVWVACKLYPAHATTNSAHGVTDVAAIRPVLTAMERAGVVLCVHGEVTDPAVDIFDREAVFIDRVLQPLLRAFPALKVVMEHITTADAAAFGQAVAEVPRLVRPGATAIGEALLAAARLLLAAPAGSGRQVIDVVGDGRSNAGAAPDAVRDELAAAGVTINGLCLLRSEPDLVATYEREVIGGPGAFALPCPDYPAFADAIRRKLLRELRLSSR